MSLSLPTYIYSTSIAVTTTTTITTTTTTITFTLYLTSIFYQSFSQLRQVPKEDTCISFCTSLKYVIINVFQQYKCCNVINMLEITSIKCEIIYHPSLKSLGPFLGPETVPCGISAPTAIVLDTDSLTLTLRNSLEKREMDNISIQVYNCKKYYNHPK